jgi:predicted nucleic acid-binding protein
MKVLIDTSVWSLALRRTDKKKEKSTQAAVLMELIEEERAEIIGPIRQELLSGIRTSEQYLVLREKLRAFKDIEIFTRPLPSLAVATASPTQPSMFSAE